MSVEGGNHDAAEVPDRKRLALSIAGAMLISTGGFALILVLIAQLPRLLVDPNGCLNPTFAAFLSMFNSTIMRVFIPMLPMLMVFPAVLAAARKRRGTSTARPVRKS